MDDATIIKGREPDADDPFIPLLLLQPKTIDL